MIAGVDVEGTTDTPAVIGHGITVKGDLTGDGDMVVDGRIEGRVHLRAELVVEATGSIEADVAVRALVVRGKVNGNIDAEEHVELDASAVVSGDIRAPSIVIRDGAVVRGRIEMDVELPEGCARRTRADNDGRGFGQRR